MCYKFIPNELYCILNSAFSILINLTIIDHDLSGKTMGNSIIKRITASLKFMYRKKECLKFTERKLLCVFCCYNLGLIIDIMYTIEV